MGTGKSRKRTAASGGRIRQSLQFSGTWRSYQKRVLKNAETYGKDGKIHIVAAPGSGKTTLGIELIARADAPCLILAPSVTIREQWLSRIREGFGAPEELLSNDIRNAAPITAITYQGLHSCLKKLKSVEEDEDGIREEKDYSRFDLYEAIKKAGFRTFCLDEAHHLRSEWQKALEEVLGHCRGCVTISLTATPPYDSTPAQWERYIRLCGPIDEEISVPELVKEKSLCPHQDYVYFNMPAPEEMEELETFRKASAQVYRKLMADERFAAAVQTHAVLTCPEEYLKQFEGNIPYLTALLSFLKEKGKRIPDGLKSLIGLTELPPMDRALLAELLQGFLWEDADSYACEEGYQKKLAAALRAKGLIHQNRVELAASSAVDKMLMNSRGKLISMQKIVKKEYENLGEELRLLILTDFIRGEYLSAVGVIAKPVQEIGVVPIFESLRRECSGMDVRLAALSGSVVILPECAKEAFVEMAEKNGQKAILKPCLDTGYYRADISGGGPRMTVYLTELFAAGFIRVLIGTKSLLGEGWDSPCINSLILASFVGSFMLSNQMRGRAIRTVKENPDKVSNIWHLICMEPVWTEKEGGEKTCRSRESSSADFATLRRRFEGFLGIHYEKDVIESGLDRLTCIRPPYGNRELDVINAKMEELSGQRAGLRERWDRSLARLINMEIVDKVGAGEQDLKAENQRKKFGKQEEKAKSALGIMAVLGVILALLGYFILAGAVMLAAAAVCFVLSCIRKQMAVFTRPELFLKAVADAVLAALKEVGALSSAGLSTEVQTKESRKEGEVPVCFSVLQGGTQREKNVFADTLAEFLGEVNGQRYLLEVSDPGKEGRSCYPVPELFGRKKEDASLFARHIVPCIGASDLIFTRSEEGRRALLAAGMKEMRQERVIRHKEVQNR